MKKSVIAALALSLMLVAGAAGASVIGIFGEPEAVTCTGDFSVQYTTAVVHFAALLDDVGSISACEFGADGIDLVSRPEVATQTALWETDLVIGNIFGDGVALAFAEPLAAPVAYLGRLEYFLLAALPPDEVVMSIVPTILGNLLIVDFDTAAEIPAEGWSLVVNCTVGGPFGNCLCMDPIATEDANWGQIKALY
jgi:hypothetical protein